jgi:beta-lactam-binding protein with PASTA domain
MIGITEIKAGTLIPKGTTINLTLGDGLSNIVVTPPFVIGNKYEEVQAALASSGITANYYFDKDVKDTANAVVYRQYPSALNDEKINMGESMDIFLGTKIPQNILKDSALKARLNLK